MPTKTKTKTPTKAKSKYSKYDAATREYMTYIIDNLGKGVKDDEFTRGKTSVEIQKMLWGYYPPNKKPS